MLLANNKRPTPAARCWELEGCEETRDRKCSQRD
jgi:hypothetical protein